jgi:hypothetical protein
MDRSTKVALAVFVLAALLAVATLAMAFVAPDVLNP